MEYRRREPSYPLLSRYLPRLYRFPGFLLFRLVRVLFPHDERNDIYGQPEEKGHHHGGETVAQYPVHCYLRYLYKYGDYKIFLHGIYDGQIITLSNEGTDISYYQLNVPALNLNPILWDFLADTFPNPLQYKIEKSHHLNRMHNIHCRLHLKNSLELIALTGSFESPYTPFVNVKNLNHH